MNNLKNENMKYEPNPKAIRKRKVPELTETTTLETQNGRNVTKYVVGYGMTIIMTITGTLVVSYLLRNIVTFDIFFHTIMFALLVIVIGIGVVAPMILLRWLNDVWINT